jgi:hypothetical protein
MENTDWTERGRAENTQVYSTLWASKGPVEARASTREAFRLYCNTLYLPLHV